MHAICKNTEIKNIFLINPFKMIPFQLHIHMCSHVMQTCDYCHHKMFYAKLYECTC
jgi:hypothetical protein